MPLTIGDPTQIDRKSCISNEELNRRTLNGLSKKKLEQLQTLSEKVQGKVNEGFYSCGPNYHLIEKLKNQLYFGAKTRLCIWLHAAASFLGLESRESYYEAIAKKIEGLGKKIGFNLPKTINERAAERTVADVIFRETVIARLGITLAKIKGESLEIDDPEIQKEFPDFCLSESQLARAESVESLLLDGKVPISQWQNESLLRELLELLERGQRKDPVPPSLIRSKSAPPVMPAQIASIVIRGVAKRLMSPKSNKGLKRLFNPDPDAKNAQRTFTAKDFAHIFSSHSPFETVRIGPREADDKVEQPIEEEQGKRLEVIEEEQTTPEKESDIFQVLQKEYQSEDEKNLRAFASLAQKTCALVQEPFAIGGLVWLIAGALYQSGQAATSEAIQNAISGFRQQDAKPEPIAVY